MEGIEELFRAISAAAIEEHMALESPEWISERKARLMYGPNLKKWVECGLVFPVQQEAIGKRVYEAHRLKALHAYYLNGGKLFELSKLIEKTNFIQNGNR